MKKVTIKSELTDKEMMCVVEKMLDAINNNEKPIHTVPDLVMSLGLVMTSVLGSVAEVNPPKARTIWLNTAIKVNDYLKKNVGSPLDIKIMDDEPLRD